MDKQLLETHAVYEATDTHFGTFTYLVLREVKHPHGWDLPAWHVLLLDGSYPLGEPGTVCVITPGMWAFSQSKRIQ